MTMDVFGVLLLLFTGIGIAEVYHARQKVLVRAIQGKLPSRPSPRLAPQPRMRPELANHVQMRDYPTPAVAIRKRYDKVIPMEVWVKLEKERKALARRQGGEWRVG